MTVASFMLNLTAKLRKEKASILRQQGWIPAVLYGPKTKNQTLQVKEMDFDKVFDQAGESALINLKIKPIESKGKPQESLVLIHEIQKDPVTDEIIHVDFFAPRLDKKMHVTVPLLFEGHSLAVEDLDGTLVKNIQEVEVEVLPKDLPHELKVDISGLKTFEDKILIKDLDVPQDVKLLADPEEVIASAIPPRSEEEIAALEEAPEEKVEEVEKVGEEEGEKGEKAVPAEEKAVERAEGEEESKS